ncbi:MAG: nucleotidyltransferase family protein [Desulfobacterales bacterium]
MTWKKPTTGIILAAGMSTRFGKPKQLLRLKGKYLIEWVLDAVLNSHLENIILVLGYKNREIFEAISEKAYHPALQVVVNDRFSEGLSQSLLAGLRMVQKTFPSVMFLLGDQPMVDSRMINHLLDRFWKSHKDICVPTFQGKRGNPAIFSRNLIISSWA